MKAIILMRNLGKDEFKEVRGTTLKEIADKICVERLGCKVVSQLAITNVGYIKGYANHTALEMLWIANQNNTGSTTLFLDEPKRFLSAIHPYLGAKLLEINPLDLNELYCESAREEHERTMGSPINPNSVDYWEIS